MSLQKPEVVEQSNQVEEGKDNQVSGLPTGIPERMFVIGENPLTEALQSLAKLPYESVAFAINRIQSSLREVRPDQIKGE